MKKIIFALLATAAISSLNPTFAMEEEGDYLSASLPRITSEPGKNEQISSLQAVCHSLQNADIDAANDMLVTAGFPSFYREGRGFDQPALYNILRAVRSTLGQLVESSGKEKDSREFAPYFKFLGELLQDTDASILFPYDFTFLLPDCIHVPILQALERDRPDLDKMPPVAIYNNMTDYEVMCDFLRNGQLTNANWFLDFAERTAFYLDTFDSKKYLSLLSTRLGNMEFFFNSYSSTNKDEIFREYVGPDEGAKKWEDRTISPTIVEELKQYKALASGLKTLVDIAKSGQEFEEITSYPAFSQAIREITSDPAFFQTIRERMIQDS